MVKLNINGAAINTYDVAYSLFLGNRLLLQGKSLRLVFFNKLWLIKLQFFKINSIVVAVIFLIGLIRENPTYI